MSNELQLASRRRRLFATLIDAILVPCLTLLLVMMTGVLEDAEDYVDFWWILWVLVLAVVSYLLLNGYGLWRSGQTLGKMALGIAIVRNEPSAEGLFGSRPAPLWKLVCIRALFFPLLYVALVPWLALLPIVDQGLVFRKNRRCVHDLVCGTVVVRRDG